MKKRTRYFIFLCSIFVAIFFLLPTIKWYFIYSENDRSDARLDGDFLKAEIENRTNAFFDYYKDNSSDSNARKYEKENKILNKNFIKEINFFNRANPTDKIKTKDAFTYKEMHDILLNIKGKEKYVEIFFRNILEEYYISYFKEKKKIKEGIIKLGLDLQGGVYAVVTVNFNSPNLKEDYPNGINKEDKETMIDSAILKIENRINKWGVSEISIQKLKEQEKIIITLPGVKEATDLRQIIETVGILEFKLVSEKGNQVFAKIKQDADRQGKKIFLSSGKLLPEYQAKLEAEAPDVEILFTSNKDKWGKEPEQREVVAVEKESLLGRNMKILNAAVQQNNMGQNVVNFKLGDKEAKKWAQVTGDNVGKEIAIILDDVILQKPTVREKIPNGESQITLGDSPVEELRTLALILRAGSMNVPLEISEEHTVGATLGKDTIDKGILASIFGIALVFIFMFMMYSFGGVIADFAMVFNVLYLIAGLGLFKAALTLPGIAGIILTVGMAVDANVIIYERIKEEFRAGKSFKTAVDLGFNRAFWTIMDSNLTTFFAGLGLSIFGTGPIKGFAVTLCFGIVTSLFSALFLSRLMFDSMTSLQEFRTLRVLNLFRGK